MFKGLDSSSVPNASQVAQAKAASYQVWSGYLVTHFTQQPDGTRSNPYRVYHPWTKAEFDVARQCGNQPIAYCSGWDDPVGCKALAAQWDVRLCLDVESSIRGDGSWVQGWLDASGAGLYGNSPVFAGRRAPFFILAAYPGYDPGKTWPSTPPAVPHGWQYQGTHSIFGIGVDTTNFDDWFGQSSPSPQHQEDEMYLIRNELSGEVVLVIGNVPTHMPGDGNTLTNLVAAGVKSIDFTDQDFQATMANLKAAQQGVSGSLSVSGTLNVT